MAQYQNTQDILTRAQKKTGEPTNGNSSYAESTMEYLSDVQRKLVAGGSIFDVTVDEVWPWARAEQPIVIQVLPKYATGTLSLTYGSLAGTFSSAPSYSVAGWFIRNPSTEETYRVAYHTAASVNFVLDTPFLGTTDPLFAFELYKLDYDIVPEYIFVTSTSNTMSFSENADGSAEFSASITPGAYTPSAFATAWQTAINAAGTDTFTVTYDANTRLFTFSSDGSAFQIIGERGSNLSSGMALAGFDFRNHNGQLSYTGVYALGGISRIVAPIKFIANSDGAESLILGTDPLTFEKNFTYRNAEEGSPAFFAKIKEDKSGKVTIRLSSFPSEIGRMEVNYCPVPVDLQNSSSSVPLLPMKYFNFLEYAAAYFIFLEKEDSKKDEYLALAKTELIAMQKHYRGELFRSTEGFGYIAPRSHSLQPWHKRLRYGYDKDKY